MARDLTYEELEKKVHDLESQLKKLKGFENESENQLKKFRVLYDLAIAMTAQKSLDENLQLVVDKSRDLLGSDTCYIALRDEPNKEVYMHSFSGLKKEASKTLRLPFGEGLGGRVAETRQGYIVEDYYANKHITPAAHKIAASEGIVSGMAAPIQMGERNLGVLHVFNRKKTKFSQSDLDTLFLIGNLAAVEIARKQVGAALRNARDELEIRVEERTAELLDANRLLNLENNQRKEAEKALRESEKRLSQIVEGNAIATFVVSDKHVFTHWNKACEILTGFSAKEIIGTDDLSRPFYSKKRRVLPNLILDEASEDEITEYYGDKFQKSHVIEGAYEVEDFFPNLGENGKWLFFTGSPLTDADGKKSGVILTLQDVTERKQAEGALRESERRFRTLLDFAPYPIVVFTLEGAVFYLNPAFTEVFGWSLRELRGKKIPYVPPGHEKETSEGIKKLFEEGVLLRLETRRLTKEGRILDVVMRAALFTDSENNPAGEVVTLRDITEERRISQNNEAMFRISRALPEHTDLGDLLDFISGEVKRLLNTQGGLVILLDEEKHELFFPGVAYDDSAIEKRIKSMRFPMEHMDQIVVPKGVNTGEPILVNDTSKIQKSYPKRDRILGYETKSFLQVSLRSSDRTIGVLTAVNKKEGAFDQKDVELLSMIAGTVALSIENARFSEDLIKAYREVTSLNRAKDKVFHHLSHELKTPLSILYPSLNLLSKKLKSIPEETWKPTIDRAKRNLDRLVEMQYQVEDIIQEKDYKVRNILSLLLDLCADKLEVLFAEQLGEGQVVNSVREQIEEIFGPKEMVVVELSLKEEADSRLKELETSFSHREVIISRQFEEVPSIRMPLDPLHKVLDGLIKNAIENTPDEGKIELYVVEKDEGVYFVVHDYGVGITLESQKRIFGGFFVTQDTMAYSSKRPFDFNAGGKGADLLRMKIFSERYNFTIDMESKRCRFIPRETDICPGRISECKFCSQVQDCHKSGGTVFSVLFPKAQ